MHRGAVDALDQRQQARCGLLDRFAREQGGRHRLARGHLRGFHREAGGTGPQCGALRLHRKMPEPMRGERVAATACPVHLAGGQARQPLHRARIASAQPPHSAVEIGLDEQRIDRAEAVCRPRREPRTLEPARLAPDHAVDVPIEDFAARGIGGVGQHHPQPIGDSRGDDGERHVAEPRGERLDPRQQPVGVDADRLIALRTPDAEDRARDDRIADPVLLAPVPMAQDELDRVDMPFVDPRKREAGAAQRRQQREHRLCAWRARSPTAATTIRR